MLAWRRRAAAASTSTSTADRRSRRRLMDGSWNNIADAFMGPQIGAQLDELDSLFSRFDAPPGGQYSGWYQYFDRDIRRLLGRRSSRRSRSSTAARAS